MFPKTVRVGILDYSIHFPYKFDDDECMGATMVNNIYISDTYKRKRVSNTSIVNTFLHELFHAIDSFYLSSILDDRIVTLLANGWIDILYNNDIYLDKINSVIVQMGNRFRVNIIDRNSIPFHSSQRDALVTVDVERLSLNIYKDVNADSKYLFSLMIVGIFVMINFNLFNGELTQINSDIDVKSILGKAFTQVLYDNPWILRLSDVIRSGDNS